MVQGPRGPRRDASGTRGAGAGGSRPPLEVRASVGAPAAVRREPSRDPRRGGSSGGACDAGHAAGTAGGMDPALAMRILGSVPAHQLEQEAAKMATYRAVEEQMASLIAVSTCAAVSGQLRVAFVGPSGMGKTTTLAKMAARVRITGGSIAIVNADGSGFSGPGPLEPFAAVLDVPYVLALTPEELAAPLPMPARRGCVLIYTSGMTTEDRQAIERLDDLLEAAAADEVHLVLSATTKTQDIRAALRAFKPLGVTHLLFTHLDETASCASVINTCVESGLPLSYVGTGRGIPGDLDPADPRRIARRTLQGAPIA